MPLSNKHTVIIDYGLGNLYSVHQACKSVGLNVKISNSINDILSADALILPGVGAFIEAMNNLEALGLVEPIKVMVASGKPFFGICLGMQLVFSASEEFGSGRGLDLIQGTIRKFPNSVEGRSIKVPQIAWNRIHSHQRNWDGTPLFNIDNNEYMYFVHSYYVEPHSEDPIITQTNYEGIEYCSAILSGNIFATQFHPEKSSLNGVKIYKNWALLNNLL